MSIQSNPASIFQSTLPVRGATCTLAHNNIYNGISIHAPREGSDSDVKNYLNITWISIHAPREGSDPPMWPIVNIFIISIHAPREGSDKHSQHPLDKRQNFNPRSP